jgi:hypothetical protein
MGGFIVFSHSKGQFLMLRYGLLEASVENGSWDMLELRW